MAKPEKNHRDLENQSRDPIETQPKSDIYKPEEKSAEFISTGNSFKYGLFECDKNENGWKALLASALCPCCTSGYIAEYIGTEFDYNGQNSRLTRSRRKIFYSGKR